MNKLSDEQMELLKDAKVIENINNIDIVAIPKNWLDALIVSEQAWREESLKWKNSLESHGPEGHNYTNVEYVRLLQERKEFKDKLNEAIEVLKVVASPYDDFCGSCDQAVTIEGDPSAIKFLNSLNSEVQNEKR